MGFGNDVVGGAGELIRAMIRSPNFASGVSGWTINKDGTAEFNNLALRGTFSGIDYEINASGAFFYNGTPALGNPPIFQVVPPGVTHDPFGNPAAPVLNIGPLSVAHTGFDAAGIEYLSDSSGDIRITIDPTRDFMGFYASPGLFNGGALVASVAASAGTDQAGNAYYNGMAVYSGNGPTDHYSLLQGGKILFGLNSDGGTGSAGNIVAFGPTQSMQLNPGSNVAVTGDIVLGALHHIYAGSDSTGSVKLAWQHPVSLINGWGGTFKYRYGAENELKFQCGLTPGTVADGTIIVNLTGILPAVAQMHPVYCDALKVSGSSFEGAALQLDSGGNLRIFGVGTAATTVSGAGFFPMDN